MDNLVQLYGCAMLTVHVEAPTFATDLAVKNGHVVHAEGPARYLLGWRGWDLLEHANREGWHWSLGSSPTK